MQQIITDRGGRHGDDPASPPTALNGRVFAPPWWSALTPPFTLARRDPQEALQPCAAVIGAPKVSSRRNLVVRARPGERRVSTLKSHSWPTPVGGRAGQGADIRAKVLPPIFDIPLQHFLGEGLLLPVSEIGVLQRQFCCFGLLADHKLPVRSSD